MPKKVLKHEITVKNPATGEQHTFKVVADNAGLALGKISTGEVKLDVPNPDKKGTLMKTPFLPGGKWVIVSLKYPGRNYDEMAGLKI